MPTVYATSRDLSPVTPPAAVTDPGDGVLDPAAGSYSVLTAAQPAGRQFLGCDTAQ